MPSKKTPEAPADTVFQPEPELEAAAETGAGPATVSFEPETANKRNTARAIKEEAGKIGSQAADKARGFADQGKAKATDALDEFSKLMSEAAGTVDERLGEQYGKYARSAADSLSGFAQTLRSKQVDDIVEDATEFVRKSPAVAVGIAAAVGFALARLVKSGVDAAADLGDNSTKKD